MKKIILGLFTLLTLLPQVTRGQHGSLCFENYTIRDGLSNNSINAVLQTRDGYLWMATKDGLDRFDGKAFRIFKHNPADSTSLPENYVMCLLEDRNGDFWIGTWGRGLCRFDPDRERFIHYDAPEDQDDFIQALFEDRQGTLWFGTTSGGLRSLDPVTKARRIFSKSLDHPHGFPADNITSIVQDSTGDLWLGTLDAGLIRIDLACGGYQRIPLPITAVQHVMFQSNSILWLSSDRGLYLYDLVRKQALFHPDIPVAWRGYLTTPIQQSLCDRQQRIWVGTYEYRGLMLFEPDRSGTSRFYHISQEDDNPHSLISDRIRCIYEDHRGNLWFGSEEGLNKLPKREPFTQYRFLPLRRNSLGGRVVSSILEGRDRRLWVGLGGGGFDCIDRVSGKIRHFKNDPLDANSLSENDVVTLYEDEEGRLWIGTSRGGLNCYDPSTGRFSRFTAEPHRPGSIASNWVQQIHKTRDGLFLVGTNAALQVFDRSSGIFSAFRPAVKPGSPAFPLTLQVNAVFEDREGELWIGTWLDGLWRYNPATLELRHYLPEPGLGHGISSTKVTTLCEDSHGAIWIGTHSGGLNCLDKRTGVFITYTTKDGLPNDVVFGIQEDQHGNLWISTLNGLARFDPRQKSFRIYDEADGIINNQFNWRASYQSSEGMIYFGGANGLIAFFPDSIRIDPSPPPVALTSLKIFNQEAVLPRPLRAMKEVMLPYRQNFFTIEFTALDIAPPRKHHFLYRLQGIDPEWTSPGIQTLAAYTDIRPGFYNFSVKACNADDIWSEPVSLAIRVLPPWWQAWWFKIGIALLAIGATFAVYRYRIRRLLQIYRIRFNIASDLHDEIGSNLSSISVESQMVLQNGNLQPELKEQLTTISQTARETVDAMRDIVWFINPRNDSGENVLFKLKETASRLLFGMNWSFADSTNLRLDLFNLEIRRHLFLIYKEALTNVVRHSGASDCHIAIEASANGMKLLIRDNGRGFDRGAVEAHTGLHSMDRRAEKIHAILDVESAPGSGTTVMVTVPYPKYASVWKNVVVKTGRLILSSKNIFQRRGSQRRKS